MGIASKGSSPVPTAGFSVVIAGGGVAALESATALAAIAGDRVALTVIAPEEEFTYRPLTPLEAFGHPAAPRFALAALTDLLRARLVSDRVGWIDRKARRVHLDSGAKLAFDALVLGLGAVPRALYQHAITIGDPAAALLPHLIDDLDAGRVTRLAFIAPERTAWPLPLYEVALMCAARAGDRNLAVELTVITAERTPLHIFGETASTQMTRLLSEHGIEIVCDARCDVPAPGRVVITAARCPPALHSPPTRALSVDRVVAVPELVGPHVRGLPCAENGFIPIDRFCRVPGTKAIFAAGDATDYAIKHGGIAAQQADVAARSIAALAGAAVTPRPFHPTIAGLLLTGGEPRYLTARVTGGEPFGSRMTVPVAEATPPKIAARYLNELLQRLQR